MGENAKVTWQSSVKCDCCHRDATRVDRHFYDCKTKFHGRWALLCEECFKAVGLGLGTGVGQQYSSTTREKTGG